MLTYREIKDVLDNMTNEQLEQQAQVFISPVDGDKPIPLHMVIAFKTVKELVTGVETGEQLDTTRSSVDNEHHPEEFVFLMDWNPYAEDGAIAYDLESGEPIYPNNVKKNIEVEDEFSNTFGTNTNEE